MKDLDKLSEEQEKIVTSDPDHSILVKAAAGTGKTRVLIERIIYLINECGVDPKSILAITFTNKAANEMKKRIISRIKNSGKRPESIETIDSAFSRILREYINLLNLGWSQEFQNLDSHDDWIKKRIAKCWNNNFEDKKIYSKNIDAVSEVVKKFAEIREKVAENSKLKDSQDPAIKAFVEYENFLIENNYLDFDGVIFYARKLLEDKPEVRNKWIKRYKYIFVDEIQDLNISRWKLIKLLLKNNHTSFLGIGDPNQSVYLYGGDIVEDIFKEVAQHININFFAYLGINYRSLPKIVEWSSKYRRIKNQDIVPHLSCDGREPIYEIEELGELIRKIKNCGQYENWAILYRNNSTGDQIWECLLDNNINFQISKFKFLKSDSIEYLIFFLRAIFFDNPKLIRRIIWKKKFFPFGFSEKTKNLINQQNIFEGVEKKQLIEDELQLLEKFLKTFRDLRNFPKDNLSNIAKYVSENFMKSEGYDKKIPKFIKWLSKIQPHPSIDSSIEILINIEEIAQNPRDKERRVSLSTIHSSKGLEWDNVVIINFGEVSKETQGEDKNLAYVAASRAKKNIYMIDINTKNK